MNNGVIQSMGSAGAGGLFVMLITSSVLLAVAVAASALLKRSSAANRFTVWQFSFAGLLVVPIAVIWFPTIPLGWLEAAELSSIQSSARLPEEFDRTERPVVLESEQDHSVFPLVSSRELSQFESHGELSVDASPELTKLPESPREQQTEPSASVTPVSLEIRPSFTLADGAVLLWAFGFFVLLFRMSSSWLAAKLIARRTVPVEPGQFNQGASLPVGVEVRLSSELRVPVITGVICPILILPDTACQWSSERLNCVLKHEVAHIVRRDLIWQAVAGFAKAVYWFQPLVWLAESNMRLEREKACDDAVIRGGVRSSDYADVLLGFAKEFSRIQIGGVGALSMAQKPVENRLSSILSATTVRQDSSRRFRWLVAAFFGILAVVTCVVRPLNPIPVAASEITRTESENVSEGVPAGQVREGDAEEKSWVGKVVQVDGTPVVDARINFVIRFNEDSGKRSSPWIQIALPTAVSDAAGNYKLTMGDFDFEATDYSIQGFVTADGYPDREFDYFAVRYRPEKPFHDVVMQPGRKVTGRIVAPEGSPDQAADVFVRLVGDGEPSRYSQYWHSAVIHCDDLGRFEAYVPRVGRVELTATASNYAGVQVPVAPQYSDQGDIELKVGKSVFGSVRDRNGNPVSGVIVKIEENPKSTYVQPGSRAMFEAIRPIVVTDAQGNYRLPPFTGACRLSLDRLGKRRGEDQLVIATSRIPVVMPRLVDLDDDGAELRQDFREETTAVIRGQIRWEDGTPGTDVQVEALAGLGNSNIVSVDRTFTANDGSYELRFPPGVERHFASVSVYRFVSIDGIHVAVRQNIKEPNTKRHVTLGHDGTSIQFANTDVDLDGVDWVLSEQKSDSIPVVNVSDRSSESRKILHDIGKRYYREQATHSLKLRMAKTDPERNAISAEDWAKPYVAELRQFEKDYRGEDIALMALRQLMGMDSRFAPLHYAEKDAGNELVGLNQILTEHYMGHPDLDLAIGRDLTPLIDASDIAALELIATESPHRRIRATAIFYLCFRLHEKLRMREFLEQNSWRVTFGNRAGETKTLDLRADLSDSDDPAEREYANYAKFLRSLLSGFDPDEMRDQLRNWTNLLERDYSDVVGSSESAIAIDSKPGFYYTKSNRVPVNSRTFVERIRPLVFEAKFLQPGQVAPEIHGTDGLGDPFSLRSLKGKVVLLYFGRSTRDLEKYQALKSKFSGQPFEIVGILLDDKIEAIKQAIDDQKITWQTVWDGMGGPIESRWRTGELDIFLIDSKGVIKRRAMDGQVLDEIIQRMIDEVE